MSWWPTFSANPTSAPPVEGAKLPTSLFKYPTKTRAVSEATAAESVEQEPQEPLTLQQALQQGVGALVQQRWNKFGRQPVGPATMPPPAGSVEEVKPELPLRRPSGGGGKVRRTRRHTRRHTRGCKRIHTRRNKRRSRR
jgi:hypothetical protein